MFSLLYLVLWIFSILYFIKQNKFYNKYCYSLISISIVLHLLERLFYSFKAERCPLGNVPEFLSVFSLTILVLYLILISLYKIHGTGVLIIGLVLIINIMSYIPASSTTLNPIVSKVSYSLHSGIAIFSYSSFCLSGIFSLLYLFLNYCIKHQMFGMIYSRMPSIEVLEGVSSFTTIIGFVFLSISIIFGIVLYYTVYNYIKIDDFKIISILLIWLFYLLALILRIKLRWKGKKSAVLFLFGFIFIISTMIITNIWSISFHKF